MTQIVKDDKGNVLGEFPDDATPEEIEKALSGPAPNEPGAPMVQTPNLGAPWKAAPPDFQIPLISTEKMPWYESYPEIAGQGIVKGFQKTLGAPRALIDWWRGHYEPTGETTTFYNDLGFPQEMDTFNYVPPDEPLDVNSPALARLFEPYEKIRRDQAYNSMRRGGMLLQDVTPTTGGERVTSAGAEGVGAGLVGGPAGAVMGGIGAAGGQTARELGAPEPVAFGIELLSGLTGPGAVSKVGRAVKSLAIADVPEKLMARAVQIMEPHEIDTALELMRNARRMDPDHAVTFAEAANQVTNGRAKELLTLQRYVEPYSQPLQSAMAERPAAARRIMERQTEQIAGGELPTGEAAARLPIDVQRRGEQAINRFHGGVTEGSGYNYRQALDRPVEQVIGQHFNDWENLMGRDALANAYEVSLRRGRNTGTPPAQWAVVENGRLRVVNLPTPEEIDAMKKVLDAQIANLETVGGKFPDPEGLIPARDALVQLAERTLPQYRSARFAHGEMAESLAATEKGPLGAIAKSDRPTAETMTEAQKGALMPKNPSRATNPETLRMTVRQLQGGPYSPMRRRPRDPAARQQIASILGDEFDEATRGLSGAPVAQRGPSKFRAGIAGNIRQNENLRAVVEEAAGPEVWQGFNRFLDTLEAQGYRQGEGSPTNLFQVFRSMFETPKHGVGAEDVIQAGVTGGGSWALKGVQGVTNKVQELRHMKRANRVGELLLDPDQADLWRSLAGMDPRSPNALRITQQLMGLMAATGATSQGDVTQFPLTGGQ